MTAGGRHPDPREATRAEVARVQSRVFVVGYMHSGTTMMLRALENHPDLLASKRETKFFERLSIFKRAYPNLSDPAIRAPATRSVADIAFFGAKTTNVDGTPRYSAVKPEQLDAVERATRGITDHGRLFSAAFDALALHHRKLGWVEKTPTHVFNLAEIAAAVPEVRVIEMCRDPRDVLASKKTRRRTVMASSSSPMEKRWEKAFHPLWDSLSWRSAISAAAAFRNADPSQIMRIRYEDLVRDPESGLRKVCEFLGLDYSSQTTDVRVRNAADGELAGQPGIDDSSVGRWRNVLTPAEALVIELVTRKDMTALGYPTQRHPLSAWLGTARYLLLAPWELVSRLYRRFRLHGFRYMRLVARRYGSRLGVLLRRGRGTTAAREPAP